MLCMKLCKQRHCQGHHGRSKVLRQTPTFPSRSMHAQASAGLTCGVHGVWVIDEEVLLLRNQLTQG